MCRRSNMMYRCSSMRCGCSLRCWCSVVLRGSLVWCRRCVRCWLRLLWCWLVGSGWRFVVCGRCCCGVRSGLMMSDGLLVMSDCRCVMGNGCLMVGGGSFVLHGGLKGLGCSHVVISI